MSVRLTILALAACAGTLGADLGRAGAARAAQDEDAGRAQEPLPESVPGSAPPAEAAHRLPWAEELGRAGRVAFARRSAIVAEADLERGFLSAEQRAAATLALGASGSAAARTRLMGIASEGPLPERLGAVFGLGELRGELGPGEKLLADLLEASDPLVAECALLAWLRSGSPAGRARVVELSKSSGRLTRAAVLALSFEEDPEHTPEFEAARVLLELRWLAGTLYGTIDGSSWSIALVHQLATDDAFLDELVLPAAAEVYLPGVKDHLLELVLGGAGDARLRAAVRAMPRELDRLVEAGIWVPGSDREWEVVVDEALASGADARMPATMEGAMHVRSLAPSAAGSLLRREPRYEEVLLGPLERDRPSAVRLRAVRALGATGEQRFVEPLRKLEEDASSAVRAGAWVARAALGDRAAADRLREDLGGAADPAGRRELLDALAAGPRSGRQIALLTSLADSLQGLERGDATAILVLWGRTPPAGLLRTSFSLAPPGSSAARRIVRALGVFPDAADLEFLAGLFPAGDDPELNVELARALVRNGQAEATPLLQAAVWRGPWNRSLLAAAVVKERSGVRVLEQWVMKPPADATSEDIRRVGFAIGEWAGLQGLESLRQQLGGLAGAERPALQGALLGALSARTQ